MAKKCCKAYIFVIFQSFCFAINSVTTPLPLATLSVVSRSSLGPPSFIVASFLWLFSFRIAKVQRMFHTANDFIFSKKSPHLGTPSGSIFLNENMRCLCCRMPLFVVVPQCEKRTPLCSLSIHSFCRFVSSPIIITNPLKSILQWQVMKWKWPMSLLIKSEKEFPIGT